jgi:hypothetical protein
MKATTDTKATKDTKETKDTKRPSNPNPSRDTDSCAMSSGLGFSGEVLAARSGSRSLGGRIPMAEVLATFTNVLRDDNGVGYTAQACGAPGPHGLWEGWIEFTPLDGAQPIRSARETTQPNRADAVYWATGLGVVFLEGALNRALHPLTVEAEPVARPAFDRPAPRLNMVKGRSSD